MRILFLYILIYIVFAGTSVFFAGYTYFEYKYFCSLGKRNVDVSLYSGDKKCFFYLRQLDIQIDSLGREIQQIGSSQEGDNKVSILQEKQEELSSLRDQIFVAIKDYEKELFLYIKSLVGYYLMPQREIVIKKIEQSKVLLDRLQRMGDERNFLFVVKKLDILQETLMILDRIKSSRSFDELIPPLKQYLR